MRRIDFCCQEIHLYVESLLLSCKPQEQKGQTLMHEAWMGCSKPAYMSLEGESRVAYLGVHIVRAIKCSRSSCHFRCRNVFLDPFQAAKVGVLLEPHPPTTPNRLIPKTNPQPTSDPLPVQTAHTLPLNIRRHTRKSTNAIRSPDHGPRRAFIYFSSRGDNFQGVVRVLGHERLQIIQMALRRACFENDFRKAGVGFECWGQVFADDRVRGGIRVWQLFEQDLRETLEFQ